MSLTLSLATATSALQITQRGIDVVGRNIANANVQGYSEKTLGTTTLFLNGEARALTDKGLFRKVAADLAIQTNRQYGKSQQADLRAQSLERLDAVLGGPESAGSLSEQLQDVIDAFVTLKSTPESTAIQQAVVAQVQALAGTLNSLATDVIALRQESEDSIATDIDEVNRLVEEVDRINAQIGVQRASNGTTVDLEDERDRLLRQISGFLPVSTYVDSGGQLAINVGRGRSLLEAEPVPLSFAPQTIGVDSLYETPTLSPGIAPALAGVTLGGLYDISTELDGGRLAAHLELRDEILPRALAQLDEFAAVLLSATEAAGLQLFSDPLNPAFVYPGPNAVGLASRIEANPAIIADPALVRDGTGGLVAPPGDTAIIDAVLSAINDTPQSFRTNGLGPGAAPALTSRLSGQSTLRDFAVSVIAYQATVIDSANQRLEVESQLFLSLEETLIGKTGVNSDEQMTELVKLQNAYGASARVITTIQRMFDELLSAVG